MISPNPLCLRSVDFRPATDQERSQDSTGDGRTLEGYAAVFDTDTEINSWEGHFTERLAPGAFRKTLRERTPVLQFDHGHDARTGSVPIGRFEELAEDDQGLRVRARLFDNPVVEPIRQAIEGGAISGMSFRFKVIRDEWRDKDGKKVRPDELGRLLWKPGDRGPLQRTIREVQLFEAGPVVFPAYAETSVGVRSMSDLSQEEREALVAEYARTQVDDEGDPPLQRDSQPEEPTEADSAPQLPEASDAARQGTSQDAGQTPEAPPAPGTPSGHAAPPQRKAQPPAPQIRKESVPMDHPMTVEERASRQTEIRSRLSEIDSEFAGGVLPTETQSEWDSLNEEYREHEEAIAAAEERAAQLRALAGDPTKRERGAGNRGPYVQRRKVDDIYDLAEIRRSVSSVDDLAHAYRDNALRAVEQGRFPGSESREAAQEAVVDLLHNVDDKNATLARRLLATGSPVYERAFGKVVANQSTDSLTSEERAALAVGTGSAGGFAVPYQLDPTVILTNAGSASPLRRISRVEQIVGNEWRGLTSDTVTVSRGAEGAEVSDGNVSFAQPTVKPTRVTGFVPFSMELEQDWSQMRSELTRILADAKDNEEATAFVTGSGTGNNPEGVLTGATTAVDTAGAFAASHVYKLEEAVPVRFRSRSHFLANKAIYNQIRQFGSSDGHALWERIGAGQPAELLGYPAHEASAMSSSFGTLGDKFLLFGDFQQFLIVDRIGMSVELVPHLFGATNRFPTGQRGILAVWRNGSKVLVPGAFRVLNKT